MTRWMAALRLTPPSRQSTIMSRTSGMARRKFLWRRRTRCRSHMTGAVMPMDVASRLAISA